MSDDDKNMSLADKLRAKKEAEEAAKAEEKPMSLADKLRAQKAAQEEAEAPKSGGSMADRLRASKEGEQAAPSLSDRLRGKADDAGEPLDEAATIEIKSSIDEINKNFKSLIDRVNLTSLANNIASVGNQTTALPASIKTVRDKGYAYRSYLEGKVEVLKEQWDKVNVDIKEWVANEAKSLKADLDQAEPQVKQLVGVTALTTATQTAVAHAQHAIETLEAKVKAAEDHIGGQYYAIQREVDQTNRQVKEIQWILEQKDEASFDFGAAEDVYLVAKAEWDDGKDKPDGMLFLTNHRLVFEQKEKTGKKFGMFGGKETQGILWEAPISSVETVKAENKGLMGGKDMVYIHFGSGASYSDITVEVKGGVDCKYWATQIQRMATGNADDERAIQIDPELIENLKNAPTACPVCGGNLPKIVAGQNEITCQYCGTSIRI